MKRILSMNRDGDNSPESDIICGSRISKRPTTSHTVENEESSIETVNTRSVNSISPDCTTPVAPGFLTKSFEIFSNEAFSDLCGWGPNGDTIIIHKIQEFSNIVLPKYFKHKNFPSFVRQLHIYNFRKTVKDPSNGEFKHEYFKKGRPDLLHLMKRKSIQSASTPSDLRNSNGRTGLRFKTLANGCRPDIQVDRDLLRDSMSHRESHVQMNGCMMMPQDGFMDQNSRYMEFSQLHMLTKQLEGRVKDLEAFSQSMKKSNDILWKTLQQQSASHLKMQSKMLNLLNNFDNSKLPVDMKKEISNTDYEWWETANLKMHAYMKHEFNHPSEQGIPQQQSFHNANDAHAYNRSLMGNASVHGMGNIGMNVKNYQPNADLQPNGIFNHSLNHTEFHSMKCNPAMKSPLENGNFRSDLSSKKDMISFTEQPQANIFRN